MNLTEHKRGIGVFPNHQDAEYALTSLRDSGFNMDHVSVINRNAEHESSIGGVETQAEIGNKADEGAKTGAVTGTAVGGLTGLLVGLGTLAIPGIGPVMLAGAAATAIATTIAGAGIGAAAGSLAGALIGLGIPEERAHIYNERVSRGEYLVIVDGTQEEIHRAETILRNRNIQEFGIYNSPSAPVTKEIISPTAEYVAPAPHPVMTTNTDHEPKVIVIDHRKETI